MDFDDKVADVVLRMGFHAKVLRTELPGPDHSAGCKVDFLRGLKAEGDSFDATR